LEPGAFIEKSRPPREAEVPRVLGSVASQWDELRAWAAERFAPLTEEWTFSGTKYGWSLRVKQKKRAVMYLTPCAGYFRASFALGEAALAAALESRPAAALLRILQEAPSYPEGRAVRIEVRNARQVAWVRKVAEVKMAH